MGIIAIAIAKITIVAALTNETTAVALSTVLKTLGISQASAFGNSSANAIVLDVARETRAIVKNMAAVTAVEASA